MALRDHAQFSLTRRLAQSIKRGFTLIELIVVMAIILLLAAIALPAYLNQTQESENTAAQSALIVAAQNGRSAYLTNGSTLPPLGGATTSGTLLDYLQTSEPELTFAAGGGFPAAGSGIINVAESNTGNEIVYRTTSASGTQFDYGDNLSGAAVLQQSPASQSLYAPTNNEFTADQSSFVDGDVAGWTPYAGGDSIPDPTVSTTWTENGGDDSLNLAGDFQTGTYVEMDSPAVPVVASETYAATFELNTYELPTGDSVFAAISWYSASGTYLLTSSQSCSAATGITDCAVTSTAPAGAGEMRLVPALEGSVYGDYSYSITDATIGDAGDPTYSNGLSW